MECDKSCHIADYLDYENGKCRNKLVNKLIEECNANVEKIAGATLFEHGNECVCSCTICVVLAVITLTISIWIGVYFAYSRWYSKKDLLVTKN